MDNDFKDTRIEVLPAGKCLGPSKLEPVRDTKRTGRNERDTMFACLQEVVMDGLRHGFFDFSINCELVKDRKRRVVIKAGKNFQFTIKEEDLRD
jgi:hypothetical protein